MKLKPIDQQVIVVVGCTSGIGLETARRFARKGARQLVLVGRGQSDLEQTLKFVREEGGEGITVEADVADYDQVKNIAQRAVDTYGRIDTWAHVAGVPYYSRFEDMPVDDFRRVIDVNLNGPTYALMTALPVIRREGRGAMIIVTSLDSKVPVPYQSAYVAAKHGLLGVIDTLRIELKEEGVPISITNIVPATINTPFFEKAMTRTGFEPNAMPPVYEPSAVADSIVYAATHAVHTINVGNASFMYQFTRRLSPRMSDAFIRGVAFKAQQTDIIKGPDAPNNLYDHKEGFHRVEGKYPTRYSRTTWMQLHPGLTLAIGGLLLVAAPVGIMYFIQQRRKPKARVKRMVNRAGKLIGNIGDLAAISAVIGFVTNLLPHKKTMRERIVDRAGDVFPPNIGPFRRQTMPEKFTSKVQDIMPKGIMPARKSMPRKAIDAVRDVAVIRMVMGPRKSFAKRTIDRLAEIVPPSDPFKDTLQVKAEKVYRKGRRDAREAYKTAQKYPEKAYDVVRKNAEDIVKETVTAAKKA